MRNRQNAATLAKEPAMTDTNKPHENHGNARTVFNPKKPGDAERVNPTNGESAGKLDTDKADE